MQTVLVMVGVALVVGCGSGEEVPSCQQAMTHFYGAGCKFLDPDSLEVIPVTTMVTNCKQLLAAAPDSCLDEVDDFRSCLGSQPNGNGTDEECSVCSPEQDALLTCD